MYKRLSIIISAVLLFIAVIPPAFAQLPQVSNGLSYLTSSQNPDGTWQTGTAQVETTAATVSVLETLKLLNQTTSTSYTTGAGWLQAQSPQSVDYIAERLHTLGLTDLTALIPSADGIKGSWGGDSGYETNLLDTAKALQALKSANYTDSTIINPALAYLTTSQNPDGGWGFYAGDSSNVYMTAIVSATLQQFPQMTVIATAVSKATAFLIAHQNSDGGFGSSSSTVYETALAYAALAAVSNNTTVLSNAVNYLTTTQSTNGSWNDDPYSTALALKALYLSENKPSPPPAPPLGATIIGTVMDAVTKKPLSGAQIALDGNTLFSATTDATGGFTMADVPPGAQKITFTLSGYAANSASTTAAAGTTASLGTITLVSAYSTGTIAGTVSDPAGIPLAGVSIIVTGAWSGSAATGADGSYFFTYITPGDVTVNAAKAGYQTLTSTGTVYARTTLTFSPRLSTTPPTATTGTLIGRVVDSYLGLPMDHLPGEQGMTVTVLGGVSVEADPNNRGSFQINGLAPGTHQVMIGTNGYKYLTFRVMITAGGITDLGTIKIESSFAMTLTGKITDAVTGAVIPGAEVMVVPGNLTSRTDSTGIYVIGGIDGSELTVKASADGYVGTSYTVGKQPWLQTMDIALQPLITKGSVTGKIVDASTNQPLQGVTLAVADNPALTATTDVSGAFTINAILKGARQIGIALNGYSPRTLTTAITAGAMTNVGTIGISVNQLGASIKGIVTDAVANAPFAGVAINATGTDTLQTATATDGSYILDNVTPGAITVEAYAPTKPAYYPARFTGVLEPGGILVFSPALSTMPPATVDVVVQTDKALYGKGEAVALTIHLQNTEVIAYDATLHTKVTDPSGATIYETALPVAVPADSPVNQGVTFALPNTAVKGDYLVRGELYDGSGRIVGYSKKTFGVATSQISITPTLPAAFTTGANSISFSLTNTGTLPVSAGTLAVTLKDPDGQVVASATQPFTLGLLENKSLTSTLAIPALKFGTYTLSYIQSDETTAGAATEISLPNTVAISAVFDNPTYRIRDNTTLTVTVSNTGRFSLGAGLPVTVTVPDAGYVGTKQLTVTPSPTGGEGVGQASVVFTFPIPETVIAGQHPAVATLTLPSGSTATQKAFLAIPESSLSLTLAKTAYTAGETIAPVIANSGGVDTPVQYKMSLYDAKAALIAEKTATETATAGSSVSPILAIPAGAVEGPYTLSTQYKDLKTGTEKTISNSLVITGVKGTVQVQTDKQIYLATENITGLGTITNTGTALQGGNAHLQVATGPGSYKQKTWTTQADFQTGVRSGVDTYGVNDWIIPDDDFEGATLDSNKWTASGDVRIESGKVVTDSSNVGSGINSRYRIEGDFDVQVDFNNLMPVSWEGVGMFASCGSNAFTIGIGNDPAGYYGSQIHVNGTGKMQNYYMGKYETSGRVRLTRVNDTIASYYWSGTAWVQVLRDTSPDYVAGTCYFNLGSSRYLGIPSSGSFDNFKVNSGRIKTENQTVDSVRLLPLKDNFDDGTLNRDRWRSSASYPASETNGVLRFYLPSNTTNADFYTSMGLSQKLVGDFDAYFDFNSISPWTTSDNHSFNLYATSPYYWMRVFMQRAYWWSGPTIGSQGTNSAGQWVFIQNTSTKGKLRIVRAGTSYTSYYWNGSAWGKVLAEAGRSDGQTTIEMSTWVGPGNNHFEALIDNFAVSSQTYPSSGTINFKYDGSGSVSWGTVNYNGTLPTGTSIKFRTRTADTDAGLATAIWSDYLTTSGSQITSPAASWIEVEATLATANTNVTPLLNDLTVTYLADPGEVLWQTEVPVDLVPNALSSLNKTIGTLGVFGKLYFQGTLTSSTGQTVATSENPFYIEQGNFQMLLSPDKKVYKPGETFTITGSTRNLTSVAATGLILQIKDAAGTTLYTENFDLPANSSRPFSFTRIAGSDGTYMLKGTLTQNGATIADITDQYEVGRPNVTATVTAPDTAGTAPFQVSLALTNSGKTEAVVNIAKSFNTTAETLTIPAGETRTLQYGQQVTADTTYTFTITGDLTQTLSKTVAYAAPALSTTSITTKVTTDKVAYNPNEQATLTATLTATSFMENLSLLLTVTNSQGQAVYTDTATIAQLNQGLPLAIRKYWNVGTNPAATYLVTIQTLNNAGIVIAKSTANLVIISTTNPTALLKGQVTLDKQSILSGEPVTVSYNVANTGNVDLSTVSLAIQTINVSDQAIYNTIADQTTLPMGATHSGNGTIDTRNYSAKDYLVVLRATINGVEETLGGTYFRVEGAPSAPSLASPVNGADVNTFTPQLTVSNAADPNDDRLSYQFEIYTDSGLTTLSTSAVVPETAGMTIWTASTLTENQTYYWRARAYDGKLYGPWMPPASFRVNTVNDPPTAPTIAAPADGTAVAAFSPTLTVNNASDPDSTNLTYNFDIAVDPGFTTIVATTKGIVSGNGTTSWTVPVPLQENQWYYWRAQADDWQIEGPWSTARFQVNTANDAPTAPVIISPINGSTVAALTTNVAITNSTDPDSPAISYYFEADTVPTFDSPNIIRSGSVSAGDASTTWYLNGLMDNTRYYVRAKASDGAAESTWSEVITFFANTVNDPPTTPVPANPSDGAGVTQFSPTLTVHDSTDLDHDTLTYEFAVYADPGLTSLVTQATGINETTGITSWTVPVTLTENQKYYWQARAFDGALNSTWTQTMSFTINTANDAPSAPTAIAPAEGSTMATLTPTLTIANAIDPDSASLTYNFELYAGTSLIASKSGIPGDPSGSTSWTPDQALTDNTLYQWRARANDGSSDGPWSNMGTFTTHIPVTGIMADIRFEPETLNQKSQGNWVMVDIELPQGYKASDIASASIRLEGTLPAEPNPCQIHKGKNNDSLMVKFSRSQVIAILPEGNQVPVHVTGRVGAVQFEGVDMIRVIRME